MVYTTRAEKHLRGSGAANDKIHSFFISVAHLKMAGKKPVMRYIDFGQDC